MTEASTAVIGPDVPAIVPLHDEAQPPVPTDQPDQGPATAPPRAGVGVDLGLIRLAQPKDFAAMLGLCRLMHAETGIYSLDEQKVARVLANSIAMDGGIAGVIGDPDPVAIIILAVGSVWYSDEKNLGELLFFVHPDHRRSVYAKTLIAWAKHVSDQMGMVLSMAVFNRKRQEAKLALCGRQLKPAGGIFLHNEHLASAMTSRSDGAAA